MKAPLLLLLYPLFVHSTYVPGTPGAPWTDEEVLAVKAKLRQGFQMSPSQLMRETLKALGESTDLMQNETAYRGETNPGVQFNTVPKTVPKIIPKNPSKSTVRKFKK